MRGKNKQASSKLPGRKRRTKTLLKWFVVIALIFCLCNQGLPNVYAIEETPQSSPTFSKTKDVAQPEATVQEGQSSASERVETVEEDKAQPNKEEVKEEEVKKQAEEKNEEEQVKKQVEKKNEEEQVQKQVEKKNEEEQVQKQAEKKSEKEEKKIENSEDTQGVTKTKATDEKKDDQQDTSKMLVHETKQDWEKSMSAAQLTGICWTKDVVQIARTQLGYKQQEMEDKQVVSRYGEWNGTPDEKQWDALFVAFCLSYAKVPQDAFPQKDDSNAWMKVLKERNLFEKTKGIVPEAGDLLFFKTEEGKASVGIISDVKGANGVFTLTVIGKTELSLVNEFTIRSTDEKILGYGELAKKEDEVKRSYQDDKLSLLAEAEGLSDSEDLRVEPADKSSKDKEVDTAVAAFAKENDSKVMETSARLQMQVFTKSGKTDKLASVTVKGVFKGMKETKLYAVEAGDSVSIVPVEDASDITLTTSKVSSIEFVALEKDEQSIKPETTTAPKETMLPESSNEEAETVLQENSDVPEETASPEEGKEQLGEMSAEPTTVTLFLSAAGAAKKAARLKGASGATEEKPTIHKQIDYLGDGIENADAGYPAGTDLTDRYRLYLDATGFSKTETQPVDVLFVVDTSGSMNYDVNTGAEKPVTTSRISAVNEILGGNQGLIGKVLGMNAANKVAMIKFAEKSTTVELIKDKTWISKSDIVDRTISTNLTATGGTNYTAAYIKADQVFNSVENDGNAKVMIFLSDGYPTFWTDDNGNVQGNGYTYVNDYTEYDRWGKQIFGKDSTRVQKTYDKRFKNSNPDVNVYTIGITKSDTANEYDSTILRYMGGDNHYYMASSYDGLLDTFTKILLSMANVTISDTLSEYVDLDGADANVIITVKKGQTVTTLWNGKIGTDGTLSGTATAEGQKRLKAVNYDPATRKIQAVLDGLAADETVTLSFNVKVTDAAKEYRLSNQTYPHTGDSDTDYVGNTTSSKKAGFYSNKEATLGYDFGGTPQTPIAYPNPVVQTEVKKAELNILKKGTTDNNKEKVLGGVTFTLYKADASWNKGEQVVTKTTEEDGTLQFADLVKGNYLLYETAPASGYLLPDNPWKVTVDINGNLTVTDSKGNKLESSNESYTILNYKIYTLPSSGGIGTYPFTILGVAAMTVGIGALLKKRKRRTFD